MNQASAGREPPIRRGRDSSAPEDIDGNLFLVWRLSAAAGRCLAVV